MRETICSMLQIISQKNLIMIRSQLVKILAIFEQMGAQPADQAQLNSMVQLF